MKIFGATEDTYGVKRHYSVHVKPGRSVTLSRSHMITGINRHSKKSYARWQLEDRIGFWRTHKGTIVPIYREGKAFRDPDPAFNTLANYTQNPFGWVEIPTLHAERLFCENVIGQFGINSFKDIYPIAELKELRNYRLIPPTLRTETRALDIMDFTRRTFGVRNYRKDLVRAVANANMPTIAVAKEFKNFVPADWLVKFISESGARANTYANVNGLREILTKINPRSYRRLLRHDFSEQDMLYLENITRQYRGHIKRISLGAQGTITIPNESFGSFTELHDRLIGHRGYGLYREKPYENEVIKLEGPHAGFLHGTKFGEYVIATAMDTDDMVSWGKYMQNCIGGYANNALGGNFTYGAVFRNDEIIANFEIDPSGQITQLLGRFNKLLDNDVRISIEGALDSVGVTVPDYYWGCPPSGNLMEPFGLGDQFEDDILDPIPPQDPTEFELLMDDLVIDPLEPPRTRIRLGGGVYLAGRDENGNEVPF